MYSERKFGGIKSWAEEDRPREKLILKGRSSLSNAELLAILIGSGTKSLSAVEVCQALLKTANNSLEELAKFSISTLTKQPGIGNAKALTIISAMELYRRRLGTVMDKQQQIQCSQDVQKAVAPVFTDLNHEEFWILLLSRSNRVMQKVQVSKGGISGTVADPKVIFGIALEGKASSIILAHNHPSGNLKPSQADLSLTKKMVSAGEHMDLPVLDHIIFSNEGYFSFSDEGLI